MQSTEVLHFADFGGQALTLLFALLAIASSAVILTGNLTWLEIRRTQDRLLHTILARLTAGHGAVVGVDVGATVCGLGLLALAACIDVEAAAPEASDSPPETAGRSPASRPDEASLETA